MSDFKVLASSSTFISPTAQGLNTYLNARVQEAHTKLQTGRLPSDSWVTLFNQCVAQLPAKAISKEEWDTLSNSLELLPLKVLAKMDLKGLGKKLTDSTQALALRALKSSTTLEWRSLEWKFSMTFRRMAPLDADRGFFESALEAIGALGASADNKFIRSVLPGINFSQNHEMYLAQAFLAVAPSLYRFYTTYKDQPAYVEDCKRLSADVKRYFVAVHPEERRAIESYSELLCATYLSTSPTAEQIQQHIPGEYPKELVKLFAEYAAPSAAEWDGWTLVLCCDLLNKQCQNLASQNDLSPSTLLMLAGSLLAAPALMRSSSWSPFLRSFLRLCLLAVEREQKDYMSSQAWEALDLLFYAVRRTATYLGKEEQLLKEAAHLLHWAALRSSKKATWYFHDKIKKAFLASGREKLEGDHAFFLHRWEQHASFFYEQCDLFTLQKLFFSSEQELERLLDPKAALSVQAEIKYLTNNLLGFKELGRLWHAKDPKQARTLCDQMRNWTIKNPFPHVYSLASDLLAFWPSLEQTDVNQVGQALADYKEESASEGSLKAFLARQPETRNPRLDAFISVLVAHRLSSLPAAERAQVAVWSLRHPKFKLVSNYLSQDWGRLWRASSAEAQSFTLFTQFWQEIELIAQESSEVVSRLLEILIPHFNAAELNLFLKLRPPKKEQGLFANLLSPFMLMQLLQAICIALEEKANEPLFLAEQLNLLREYGWEGEIAVENRERCARLLIEHLVTWEFDQPANRTAIIDFLAHCCFAKTKDPHAEAQQLFDKLLANML